MFSAESGTPRVPLLLESTAPFFFFYFFGGKIMSLELNLDPGPCDGRFLVPEESSCSGNTALDSKVIHFLVGFG